MDVWGYLIAGGIGFAVGVIAVGIICAAWALSIARRW